MESTIVLIEPHPNIGPMMADNLRHLLFGRHEVILVRDASDVEELLKTKKAKLVFVPYDFPTELNFHLARKIKHMHPESIVIMTSAISNESETAKKLGLDGFIPKMDFLYLHRLAPLVSPYLDALNRTSV